MAATLDWRGVPVHRPMTGEERKVIFASSLGTVFEWYDFYLYGSLAPIIAKQFFSGLDTGAAFIFALLAFAAGFLVRPFGAIVFGRIGDMIGRKSTFLVTILIMGLSTFIVGLLPSYATIGVAAPIVLVGLGMLQGLALGGEYGGAATYVAEHAPHGKRGAYTSWIQTTATLGLFLSLLVILGVRKVLGEVAFADWGWRLPFLMSIVLLGVSVWIRLSLHESPAFQKMKADGKTSKAPLAESFGQWKNLKIVILALLGLTAGQAAVWYTGQFYSLFFLTQQLKVDNISANLMIAAALLLGTPFFLLFGSLSDKIGRKPIIMAGCLLAALTYFPVFKTITHAGNPALEKALATAPVTVVADPADCGVLFDPVGGKQFRSSCDMARQILIGLSVNYEQQAGAAGSVAIIKIGDKTVPAFAGAALDDKTFAAQKALFVKAVTDGVRGAGYPASADPAKTDMPLLITCLIYLALLVTMVYGPIAAALVELFPTRIRYTAMSLPYHIGNGWFGGLLPPIVVAIVAASGNIYAGLWYPISIAVMTVVIGLIFLPETKNRDIYADD